MTPRQLAERCFALGLAERPTYMSYKLMLEDNEWRVFMSAGIAPHAIQSEADDLACMTVLRALLKHAGQYRAVGLTESPVIGGSSDYVAEITGPDEWVDVSECDKTPLSALCLCLLRARGHDVESGKE